MADLSLPLTPFEEYLLEENRPDFPCWIIVKFHFTGKFERSVLQMALDQTLARNPLLRSVVKRQGSRLFWQEKPDWKLPIEWLLGTLPSAWPKWRNLDLFQEPGFRLLLVEFETGTEMIFHVHHAIFDGKALRDVLYDLLNFYSIAKGHSVPIPEFKPEIFTKRNRLGGTLIDRFKALPSQIIGMRLTQRFLKKTITPLAHSPHVPLQSSLPPEYPALVSRRLPEELFRKVRDEAMKLKVTVNDLFIRDLFFSLGEWWDLESKGAPEDWVRVVLPVDMRKPVDRFLSAANITSIVSIDRRMKSLGKREWLLTRAHEDMNWVKHRGLRFTFWTLLRICRMRTNGIRRYSERKGCQGTIIFANHCQLITRSPLRNKQRKMEVPGAILEDMTMVSPIRPGTTAALVIGTYAGNLLADLHYDPRYHTEAQADRLLQIFIDQLNRYEGKVI